MRLWTLFALLVLVGCGHQGPPRPVELTRLETGLLPVTQLKAYFQGRQVRVDWRLPAQETPLAWVQLSLDSFRAACLACAPERGASFRLSVKGELLAAPAWSQRPKSWKNSKGRFSLLFTPPAEADWAELLFRIDYQSASGLLSPVSPPVALHQPAALPQPQALKARWLRPPPKKEATQQWPDRLRLSWTPQVQRHFTEVTPQGGLVERTEWFGLLVFADPMGIEAPLNPTPMWTGQGILALPPTRAPLSLSPQMSSQGGQRPSPLTGPLWVRFQDRFGNLSEAVPLTPEGP